MRHQKPNAAMRMMAALCVSVILFLLWPASLAANAESEAKLKVFAVMEEGKNTETVTVTMEGNPGIWGLNFKINYDSALTLQSVKKGNVFAESDAAWSNSLENKQVVFAAAASKLEDIITDGTMVTLSFAVKSGAAAEPSPVTLEIVQAINAAGEDVDITPVSDAEGGITVKPTDVIEIRGLKESYPYTGAKITPAFDVVDKGIVVKGKPKVLSPGIDYTVKYANNAKADATADVTITGKGNYTGSDVKASFTIKAADDVKDDLKDIKGAKITIIDNVLTYNGKPQYPAFELKLAETADTYEYDENTGCYKKTSGDLKMDVNAAVSNNCNKGTATILVTGANAANGKPSSVKKTFKINPLDISTAGDKLTVTVADGAASVPYAVKGAMPKAEVTYTFEGDTKPTVLTAGKDYTLKYSSNKNPGTGKLTITGKGNYAKNSGKEFTIEPLSMADAKLAAVTAYAGLKADKVKAVVLDGNGDMLKASQYSIKVYKDGKEYTDKLQAGDKISVIAAAKDAKNLAIETQTAPAEFTAAADASMDISKANITLTDSAKNGKAYTGAPVRLRGTDLEVKVKTGKTDETLNLIPEGSADSENDGYKIVSYTNNVNKGTATAVIRGTGKYSGTKTVRFKITPKTMNPMKKEG